VIYDIELGTDQGYEVDNNFGLAHKYSEQLLKRFVIFVFLLKN